MGRGVLRGCIRGGRGSLRDWLRRRVWNMGKPVRELLMQLPQNQK